MIIYLDIIFIFIYCNEPTILYNKHNSYRLIYLDISSINYSLLTQYVHRLIGDYSITLLHRLLLTVAKIRRFP